MRDDWKKIIEKEMMEDAERIMEEVNSDPSLKDVIAPEEIHEKLFAQIHEYQKQKIFEQLSEEDKELIRLGKMYKKRRKWTKYLILVAAVLVVLGVGTVCIGEGEKIFQVISEMLRGKERTTVDVGETEIITYLDEYEAYEKIEEKYGFSPVKLEYLPDNTSFYEAVFSEDIQSVNMIYVLEDGASIKYIIRPNYRESSFGTIIEDEKTQEYQMIVNNIEITVVEYNIVEKEENKWSVSFVYQDVQYLLRINNMKQKEIEKIISSLGF